MGIHQIARAPIGTHDERIERGRAHREVVALQGHAEVSLARAGRDPVAILAAQDRMRRQDLVPIRHGRMCMTPFTFYRGAAAVMAADLATTASTGLTVQLCGDAHLSNFGVFMGPDRRLVFDCNDFDETLPGPFEWDVKRLAASITVAARQLGLTDKQARRATRAGVRGYRERMAACSLREPIALHYERIEADAAIDSLRGGATRKRAAKVVARAIRKDHVRAFGKLTEVIDGRRRIVDDPPAIEHFERWEGAVPMERILDFLERYRESLAPERRAVLDRYRIVDMAHKVVGVGSVGTRCFIVLLQSGEGHPLFMQFKEATASVLEAHLGPSEFAQSGERVVHGQRLMQSAGDILLGWSRFERSDDDAGFDFYFRQLWDGKGSADVDRMTPEMLLQYAGTCGAALALGHARSTDPAIIAGYLGDSDAFDRAIQQFADAYADRTEADHRAHAEAIDSGAIAVQLGV
ncbi:MAG: DUF2252 domain-containing protein [Acidimicrobiales bacterium]